MSEAPTIPDLIDDLSDPERLMRTSAVWKLMDFGESGRAALPALIRLLDNESEMYIRLGAAGAICRIAPVEAEAILPVLMAGLHDNDFVNRDTACMFVGGIGLKAHAAIPTLLNLLDDETESVQCSASEALGRISGDWSHAVEVGVELLQSPDWLIRVVGSEHFQAIGIEAKAAIPRIRELLGSVEWQLRQDVEEVLADIEAL